MRSRDVDVVVTGIGVVSAAGRGIGSLRQVVTKGAFCGTADEGPLPVSWVGLVPEAIPEEAGFPDDRKAWLAFAALQDALEAAGPDATAETAVFFGTGLSSVTPGELAEDIYPHLDGEGFDFDAMAIDVDPARAAPRRHLPERVTQAIRERLGARGPTGTNFSACAAASQAMSEGLWAVRRGQVDRAVVGGHDSMAHPLGLMSFLVLGAVSGERCRPFDRGRDGFMLGEGAAVFVLERRDRAEARGARVLARLLGAGSSVDAHNATAPHPRGEGAERSMQAALADAGLSPEAVGYVNAHGTGTPVGDVAEAQAISRLFGQVATSSTKGAIGHTIAAAGAVEAAVCVAALQAGTLPPNVGLQAQDPCCPVRVVDGPTRLERGVMLSNSFGFGGQNATLILAHPDWKHSDA